MKHALFLAAVVALVAIVIWFAAIRIADAPAGQNGDGGLSVPGPEASYTNASPDLVRADIGAGAKVSSPLTVTGEARGFWFFEASFPVALTDWDGRIIAEVPAEAQLDPSDPSSTWMTEDFVPFKAVLEFDIPPGPGVPVNRGTLILMRDNPSGLPEHDAALEIPVVF